ncbi:ABC transporter permease [Phyllobacterium sp. SB3]|uniref:ABC transporter permease n=1 Tax=Phyllobacterium sp. SB3 TaxID=3156073 RepID=UPI0032AFC199
MSVFTITGGKTRSANAGTVRRLLRNSGGKFGLLVVLVLVVLFVFGPQLAPFGSAQQDIASRLQGPSFKHLLGTDHLGRDLLSRLIVGVRIELLVAIPSVLGALVLGLLLGLPAGYFGGAVDAAIVVILDALHALPTVVLALTLLALLGNSLGNVIFVMAISLAPSFARVARASVFSVRHSAYVEAERFLGASNGRILLLHILPNIIPPLLLLVAMSLPTAIAVETGLSFLGLGVRPPTPSWGVILADGFARVRTAPWAVLWTCLALAITTLGCTLLGETLRDILDPKRIGDQQ